MSSALAEHCVEVLEYGADRAEWLRVRGQGIGGSDCAAVMGMGGQYDSPYTVWEDKTGRAPHKPETESMFWGTAFEPIVRAVAMERLGLAVELPGTLRSLSYPWMQTNLDGAVSDGGIYEGKATGERAAHQWDGQVPDRAELQCQHNMAVSGASHAWVAGLVGGNRLKIARIERDDEIIEMICHEEARLWNAHVLTDIPPPLDPSAATRARLLRRFPRHSGTIELDEVDCGVDIARAVQLAQQWRTAADAEKAGAKAKRQAENEMRLMMGDAAALTLSGRPLAKITGATWASKQFEDAEPALASEYRIKVDAIDSKALRRDHPDVWLRHQATRFTAFPLPLPEQEG
ncbi:YqaJ viral recombinase family nuclease [Nocardia sp. NPDC004711]